MSHTIQAAARIHLLAALAALALLVLALPARAIDIQEVRGESGVTAWLVEDYTLPMVTLRFSFEGGSTQDPDGREGLAQLVTSLMDEGAGDLDADAFQTALDDAGAEMGFGAGRDTVSGSIRLLADRKREALDLLRLAILQPRFDGAPVERIRQQMLVGLAAAKRDPQTAAQERWAKEVYGDHPYARPDEGTEASLAAITADDLRGFHRAVFARERLLVSVVGAIDAATLRDELDRLFGDLPATPVLKPVADMDWRLGGTVRVDYPLPQASLQLAYPGVRRDDPDFFAAYLMNHVLGGGVFSSRLFDEVRERRGLAYRVRSSLVNHDHASGLSISTATRADRADETLSVIRDVVRKMAEEGPTEAELADAKKYVIGAYALNNLDSSSAIAGTLLSLQQDGLGKDYMDRRAGLIGAVTLDEVKAAARRLLSVEPAVLVLGPAATDTEPKG